MISPGEAGFNYLRIIIKVLIINILQKILSTHFKKFIWEKDCFQTKVDVKNYVEIF